MLHPCAWLTGANACARWQRLMEPVEADFFDFDPAVAHRLEAALLERLAMTIAVEQGKATVQRAWCEQRNEVAHGEVPDGGLQWSLPTSRYVPVYER